LNIQLWRSVRSTAVLLGEYGRGPDYAPRLSLASEAAIIVLCVGAATLARLAVGGLISGVVPYATFFPAIGVAALAGGFRAGLITWLLSIAVGLAFALGLPPSELTAPLAASAALFGFSSGIVLLLAAACRDFLWRAWRSEARYRTAAEASLSLVSFFAPNGACLERQPQWEEITGMRWPDYSGLRWQDAVHESDRPLLSRLASPQEPGPIEVEVRIRPRSTGDWHWFRVRAIALRSLDGTTVLERIGALTDIQEERLEQERREPLLADMTHRLKNFMAVLQAIVTSSVPKDDKGAAAFAETFLTRIRALGSAGDLVMQANAAKIDLADVVPVIIAPFFDGHRDRLSIEGPPLLLAEPTIGGIALALNELSTNAIKYGALSNATGKVAIRWRAEPEGDGERVTFEWTERNGPTIAQPTRQGFGTRIIRSAGRPEREQSATLTYEPEGLSCRISFRTGPNTAT
jgi:PAS domain S-box-containing protein